ncbi:MAG: hypothetical protein ABEK50_07140, partial [bacterium]
QEFIPMDYHLIREIPSEAYNSEVWKKELRTYCDLISEGPYYENTMFLIQDGWKALNGNRLIGYEFLQEGSPIYRFKNTSRDPEDYPSPELSDGLIHSAGTLTDCIDFAYSMGWEEIIFVGVDLYDNRYFWLDYDEARDRHEDEGLDADNQHKTAKPIVELVGRWQEYFKKEGVKMYSLNPKSLLTEHLPVYEL